MATSTKTKPVYTKWACRKKGCEFTHESAIPAEEAWHVDMAERHNLKPIKEGKK